MLADGTDWRENGDTDGSEWTHNRRQAPGHSLNQAAPIHEMEPQRRKQWYPRSKRYTNAVSGWAEKDKAKQMRETKKQAILGKMREANRVEEEKIRILVANVRSIQSKFRFDRYVNGMHINEYDCSISTETRLSRVEKLERQNILQTKTDRKGGVMIASKKSWNSKNIKTLRTNVAWQVLNVRECPLHVIGCYIPPYDDDSYKETMERIRFMIKDIQKKWNNAKIIIGGDFNKHIGTMYNIAKETGLVGVLSMDQATHTKGNQLDQVFTNLCITTNKLISWDQSDHVAIEVELIMKINQQDRRFGETIKRKYTQNQIRKMANSERLKQTLKALVHPFKERMKDVIMKVGDNSETSFRWYQKPYKDQVQDVGKANDHRGQQKLRESIRLQEQMELAYRQKRMGEVHAYIKQMTNVGKNLTPVQSITLDDGTEVFEQDQVQQKLLEHYKRAFKQDQVVEKEQDHNRDVHMGNIFEKGDVEAAIRKCNFKKGISVDWFDGSILRDEEIRSHFVEWAVNCLNEGQVPEYLKEGRLVAFKKDNKTNSPKCENTRPIVVNSHIYKIFEKTIIHKLDQMQSGIFKTGRYQIGFKKDNSTALGIAKIAKWMRHTRRFRSQRDAQLFIDLSKAYDSVDRNKLFLILKNRATNDTERIIVDLITTLCSGNKIYIGDDCFTQEKGVVQGGALSPNLFNVYLEEALLSDPTMRELIEQGKVCAFADDIVVLVKDKEIFSKVTQAMAGIQTAYGLSMNKTKTVYMSNSKQFTEDGELDGIKKVTSFRYLGVELGNDPIEMRRKLRQRVHGKVQSFIGRLKTDNNAIRTLLINQYILSVLRYQAAPLVAANIIKEDEVVKIDRGIRRRMYFIPRDIKNEVVEKVTGQSVWDIINNTRDMGIKIAE